MSLLDDIINEAPSLKGSSSKVSSNKKGQTLDDIISEAPPLNNSPISDIASFNNSQVKNNLDIKTGATQDPGFSYRTGLNALDSALNFTSRAAGQVQNIGTDVLTNVFSGESPMEGVDLSERLSPSQINKSPTLYDRVKGGLGNGALGTAGGFAAESLVPLVPGMKALKTGKNLFNRIFKKESEKIVSSEVKFATEVAEQMEAEKLMEQAGKLNLDKGLNVPDDVKESSKTRGFIRNFQRNTNDPELKQMAVDLPNSNYTPYSDEAAITKAKALVSSDIESAKRYVMESVGQGEKLDKDKVTTALVLMDTLNEGVRLGKNTDHEVLQIVDALAPKLTEAGQAIQAASMWSKLSAPGMYMYAKREFDKAIRKFPNLRGKLKLTEKDLSSIKFYADAISVMPEGYEKSFATAKMLQVVHNKLPKTLGSKLAMAQTISQLLNAKTMIRNTIGNVGLAVGENLVDALGVPIDMAVSLITGKRTKTFAGLGASGIAAQVSEGGKGAIKKFVEAMHGIDVRKLDSKYGLGQSDVFKSVPLKYTERFLKGVLGGTDAAFYDAAFTSELRNQMKLANVLEPTAEMFNKARATGVYRTLQDDNAFTKWFGNFKKVLNGGKDFGIGDLYIKYTKTPANLIKRAVDYSPVGFLNSLYSVSKSAGSKEEIQRTLIDSFSRMTIGSGIVGTGILLHKNGIIVGPEEEPSKVKDLKKDIGFRGYQINVDAAKRVMASGDPNKGKLQPGDKLVSFDWFQPAAFPVVMGAAINSTDNNSNNVLWDALDAVEAAQNAFVDQSVMRGVKSLSKTLGEQGLGGVIENVITEMPASFVPTFVSQMRLMKDKYARDTEGENIGETSVNKAMNRIPGASEKLPIKQDVLGRDTVTIPDEFRTPGNIMLNPAIVSRVKDDPKLNFLLNNYNETGDVRPIPGDIEKEFSMNSEKFQLSREQQREIKKAVGQSYSKLLNEKVLNGLDPEARSNMLSNILQKLRRIESLKEIASSEEGKAYIASIIEKEKNKRR